MISIVTFYDHMAMTGDLDTYVEDAKLYKDAKVTEVVDLYGAVKDLKVSLPGASKGSSGDPYGYEIHNPQAEDWVLPEDGMRQGQTFNFTIPADPSKERSATAIQMVVRGQGLYHGRPVIVIEETGTVVMSSSLLQLHAYRLLDRATGMAIRTDVMMTTGERQSMSIQVEEIKEIHL
jgi:hypothetical protein